MLAGIATFFGIQAGTLARVVRIYPDVTLTVFILVGLGVVLALIAPAVSSSDTGLWASLLLVVIGAVFGAAYLISPDLPGPGSPSPSGWFWLGALSVAILAIIVGVKKVVIPWVLVFVLLSTTCIGCGLFIATKLSVLDKVRLERAAVYSAVSTRDGVTAVEITATGSEVAGPARVRVLGDLSGTEVDLGEQVLMPSRTGALDAKATFPLSAAPWTEVRILTYQEWNTSQIEKCEPDLEQASFNLQQPSESGLSASLPLSDNGERIQITVEGRNVPAGGYVQVRTLESSNKIPIVTARSLSGSDGMISWKGNAEVAKAGTWTVFAVLCATDSECDKESELASLRTIGP